MGSSTSKCSSQEKDTCSIREKGTFTPSGSKETYFFDLKSDATHTTLYVLLNTQKKWKCVINYDNVPKGSLSNVTLSLEQLTSVLKDYLTNRERHSSFRLVEKEGSTPTLKMETKVFSTLSSTYYFSMHPSTVTDEDLLKLKGATENIDDTTKRAKQAGIILYGVAYVAWISVSIVTAGTVPPPLF